MDFSEDGNFYCSYGQDGLLVIVELSSGDIVSRQAISVNNNGIKLTKVIFGSRIADPRGFKLAQYHLLGVSEQNQLVKLIYIPRTGQVQASFIAQSTVRKEVTDLAFLSDRNYAVAVTVSGEILIVDIRAGSLLFQMGVPGQVAALQCVSVLKVSSDRRKEQQDIRRKMVY